MRRRSAKTDVCKHEFALISLRLVSMNTVELIRNTVVNQTGGAEEEILARTSLPCRRPTLSMRPSRRTENKSTHRLGDSRRILFEEVYLEGL